MTQASKRPRKPKPDAPQWALRIASARIAAGLTQERLGERIGASQSTIASYESGQNEPGIEVFKRIGEAVNAAPETLIFGNATGGEMFTQTLMTGQKELTDLFLEVIEVVIQFSKEAGIEYRSELFLSLLRGVFFEAISGDRSAPIPERVRAAMAIRKRAYEEFKATLE